MNSQINELKATIGGKVNLRNITSDKTNATEEIDMIDNERLMGARCWNVFKAGG